VSDTQDKIKAAIGNLVTLTINTSVGADKTKHAMTTVIDLLGGDITNTIDREFVTGDLKELRTFHEAQVLKGQQIIKDNIDALKSLWTLAKDAIDG
jgi:hypothetical protein